MAKEREWSWGGPHAVTTLILSSRPRATLVERDGAYGRETKAIALERERERDRARKKKKPEESTKKKKKGGKRSSWADVNWRKCGREHAFPTSICLVIVYRYNGWNEPSGLASSTLESVRWHFKTTLKLRTGFARARETEKRSGWPLAPERRERETVFALEIYWEIMERIRSLSPFFPRHIGRRHRLLSLSLSLALFLLPRRNSLRDVRGRIFSYISFIPDNPLKSKLTVGPQPLPRSFPIPSLFFFFPELPLVFPVVSRCLISLLLTTFKESPLRIFCTCACMYIVCTTMLICSLCNDKLCSKFRSVNIIVKLNN